MSDKQNPILVWFRRDLRLADHRALSAACAQGGPVIPVYIRDDDAAGDWAPGGASRWWLHMSLTALSQALKAHGSRLILRTGPTVDVLADLVGETKAAAVYATMRYEPWARRLDDTVEGALARSGVPFERFAGALLHDPSAVRTGQGSPYKVFTPFWRQIQVTVAPDEPLAAPRQVPGPSRWPGSEALDDWALLPTKPDWAAGLREAWTPGEAGAKARLTEFLKGPVRDYAKGRDYPATESTSRLSPHLHFGEISPRQCWGAAGAAASRGRTGEGGGAAAFRRELAWREFSHHLLYNWPDLPEAPFRPEFAAYPWRRSAADLKAWQTGRTGYPIVDAGMRQLWHTGWMHNRVRMIVASFLIKHLRLPWQEGERWFWDTLVDADLANNAASWQWVAGSGADAAPYFRIFNPMKQAATFDPQGDYIRAWVPELADLPAPALFAPWDAAEGELRMAGVVLGKSYPHPLVDHATARGAALKGYEAVRARADG